MSEIVKGFYDYMLKNKEYKLYSVPHIFGKSYRFIHKDYEDNSNKSSVYSNEKFEKATLLGNGEYSSEVVKNNYLHGLCNEEFIKDKESLKEIAFFIEVKKIISFIDNTELSNKNKVKLLLNIPISILEINYVDVKTLDSFINKNIDNESEKDKFFISFFKARKNQLKGSYGEKVENFLLEKYKNDETKLSPYFSFFNNINNRFNKIELDIFEEIVSLFTVRLNVRKASKILSGADEYKLQELLENIAYRYSAYNNINVGFDVLDKSLNIIELRFYQKEKKETSCTQKEFINISKDFLIEHTSQLNHSNFVALKDDYFKSWYMQKKLSENIPVNQTNLTNKHKL